MAAPDIQMQQPGAEALAPPTETPETGIPSPKDASTEGHNPESGIRSTGADFSVGEAGELLGSKYHKDYKKYFEAMCKRRGVLLTAPLRTYVDEVILADARAWMETFPVNLRSKSAYSKPKTAMLNLLSDDGVISSLGDAFCRSARAAIESAFKTHSKGIVTERLSSAPEGPGRHGRPAGCKNASTTAQAGGSAAASAVTAAATADLTRELEEARERLAALDTLAREADSRAQSTGERLQECEARLEETCIELKDARERLGSLKALFARLAQTGSLRGEMGACGEELLQELLKRW